jgi:peptidoglycan/xylan/chitin deacetylase (PgdA/CDA1 family)
MSETRLRTLTYHRILDGDAAAKVNPSLVSASPAAFDRQMAHLRRHYRVISADDVVAALRFRRPLPDRAVLITFDDGYRDFGDTAWPILRKHRLPATVFVASDYPDHPERSFWWDRLFRAFSRARVPSVHANGLGFLRLDAPETRMASLRTVQERLKRLPHADAMRLVDDLCRDLDARIEPAASVLTWKELRGLYDDGVSIGGHTRSHPAMDRLDAESVAEEVRGCRADIARHLGMTPTVFAYPFGAHNDVAVEAVRDAGFEAAFTCLDGHSDLETTDPMRLHRTNITPRTSTLIFRVRLLRIGAYIDVWRKSRTGGGRQHAAMA